MRKYIITILTVCFSAVLVAAQTHIKNQRFVQFSVGGYDKFAPDLSNYSLTAVAGKYNKKANGVMIGFVYNDKQANGIVNGNTTPLTIPVSQYYGFLRSDIPLFYNPTKTFFIRLMGQLNVGYESINDNNTFFAEAYKVENVSDFLLGFGVGTEVEFTPLIVGVNSNLNFVSKYSKLTTLPYLGVRVHF
jgi:hypothetical protein